MDAIYHYTTTKIEDVKPGSYFMFVDDHDGESLDDCVYLKIHSKTNNNAVCLCCGFTVVFDPGTEVRLLNLFEGKIETIGEKKYSIRLKIEESLN